MGEDTATCGHQVKPAEVKGMWWPETTIDYVAGEIVPCWSYGVLCSSCRAKRDDWQEEIPDGM